MFRTSTARLLGTYPLLPDGCHGRPSLWDKTMTEKLNRRKEAALLRTGLPGQEHRTPTKIPNIIIA